MLDTVRDKLREVYDHLSGKHNTILSLFIDQFEEQNVDSNIKSFDSFINDLNTKTLESFIIDFEGSNRYGHYKIDRGDYDAHGRGKPLLEYIPDLGSLDFLIPSFREVLNLDSTKWIIIHFPKVRVTNEYDKYIDIQDLYAKVKINPDGTLFEKFRLCRATYPYRQFRAGYAHSHMHRITTDTIGGWDLPCTGKGPINDTIDSLRNQYNEQLWGLFTFELAKYVTIESIAGTPYIRLESVNKGDVSESMSNLNSGYISMDFPLRHLLDAFAQYYAKQNKFKFQFAKGQYQLGENPVSAIINLSNGFIDFINNGNRLAAVLSLKALKRMGVLKEYIVANGQIYNISNTPRDVSTALQINGRELFPFKNQMVKIKILVEGNVVENKSLLFTKEYCELIITKILNIINYHYGKKQEQNQANYYQRSSTQNNPQVISGISAKPFFI